LPHIWVSPGGQCPCPSQVEALVKVAPVGGQLAPRHCTLVPHLRQWPAPSHLPSLPQVDSSSAAQPPPSSATSSGIGLQTPRALVSAHDLHTSVQPVLQQKPS